MHEGIPILNFLVPKAFTHEDGRLTGVLFEKVAAQHRRQGPPQPGADRRARRAHGMRRRAGRRRPGERLPLDRARHRPRVRPLGHAGGRSQAPCSRPCPTCSSAATRRSARRTSSGRWPTATTAAISIDKLCNGEDRARAPAARWSTCSARRWASTSGATTTTSPTTCATRCRCATRRSRSRTCKIEVELGFDRKLGYLEAQRCLNCDVQTVFDDQLCIECDACVDICPMDCITFTTNGEEADLRARLRAPAVNLTQDLYVADGAQDRPHHGQGRGRLPALRPVRRALPDRRLGHAEIPARNGTGRTAHVARR